MAKQITPTKATELCDNFDSKYTALTNLIGKDDNRSALFSLQELKDYIQYLEDANQKIDGIRVYLGSYGSNESKGTNLTTVFLAPTSNAVDNTSLNALNYSDEGKPPSKKYGK